jgi:hypothetical protein
MWHICAIETSSFHWAHHNRFSHPHCTLTSVEVASKCVGFLQLEMTEDCPNVQSWLQSYTIIRNPYIRRNYFQGMQAFISVFTEVFHLLLREIMDSSSYQQTVLSNTAFVLTSSSCVWIRLTNGKGQGVSAHSMKACRWCSSTASLILTSALEGGQWSALLPSFCQLVKRQPQGTQGGAYRVQSYLNTHLVTLNH